ncbi:putative nuclease HARBI1 [Saccostrea cucullata]
MADRFGIAKSSFHISIRRVSSGLLEIMQEVITWPETPAKMNETCQQFGEKSEFQNILGAIDGSHIPIKAPVQQPQAYFNRKKFYSIVLLACCNSKMEFTYVWTGNPGSTHDATVLRFSDLFQNSNKIPNGYCILGDSAFPIMEWLITPFRDCGNLTQQQRRFNYVHSKCRQVIERAFGMLKCRFRRLLRFDSCNMHMLVNSVLAACVLHNLCMLKSDVFEVPEVNDAEICDDALFARDGQQIRGIQLRQQMMNQL